MGCYFPLVSGSTNSQIPNRVPTFFRGNFLDSSIPNKILFCHSGWRASSVMRRLKIWCHESSQFLAHPCVLHHFVRYCAGCRSFSEIQAQVWSEMRLISWHENPLLMTDTVAIIISVLPSWSFDDLDKVSLGILMETKSECLLDHSSLLSHLFFSIRSRIPKR